MQVGVYYKWLVLLIKFCDDFLNYVYWARETKQIHVTKVYYFTKGKVRVRLQLFVNHNLNCIMS